MTKRLIILSGLEQYQKFVAAGHSISDFTVLCDNERFTDFLNGEGIAYEDVTDRDLQSDWDSINAWGWEKAAGLIKISRENGFFKELDFPSIIFLWLTVVLILAVKNHVHAQRILQKYQPAEIVIFQPQAEYLWPDYSGNAFLNYFLGEYSRAAKIKVSTLSIAGKREAILPDTSSALKKSVRNIIKGLIHRVYSFVVRPPKRADVMVYGTLRHLAATTIRLKSKSAKVIFYDDEFRVEHFQFCRTNNVLYLIPGCFHRKMKADPESFVECIGSEIERLWKSPFARGYFSYRGFDLSVFIRETFFGKSMLPYLQKLALQADRFKNIFSDCDIASILLDEDFNAHALVACLMKRRGKQVFCISHANMALDCKLDPESCSFDQSYTFVHGQHEKDTYIDRGWTAGKIEVSGSPRYDRLISLLSQKKKNSDNTARILYCAGLLWPYSPDVLGFIGCDMYGFKRSQETELKFLLDAARDLNVKVVIKPHYAEDEAMWRDYVKKLGVRCEVEVVQASRDYFELLAESDAMALCLWSSTLIEAGIAGVPVFCLDLEKQNSGQMKRLEQSGLCKIFSDESALHSALKNLAAGKNEVFSAASGAGKEYYLGKIDGQATARVSDFILKTIKGHNVSE